MTIEVCANSLQSAIIAQQAGANRVELCQNLWCGGTTPSAATIECARQQLSIDLFVLIRPRSGDFCYTDLEFEVIQRDILWCKEMGVDGVVIGILTPEGAIDYQRIFQLVRLAHPMEVTFHRAFDFTANPFDALAQLIQLNISRVLTSGFKTNAIEGQNNIKTLLEIAEDKITILAGGGINADNVSSFVQHTQIKEIHLSGKQIIKSPFAPNKMALNTGGIPEFDYQETNPETISAVVKTCNSLQI